MEYLRWGGSLKPSFHASSYFWLGHPVLCRITKNTQGLSWKPLLLVGPYLFNGHFITHTEHEALYEVHIWPNESINKNPSDMVKHLSVELSTYSVHLEILFILFRKLNQNPRHYTFILKSSDIYMSV